MAAESSIILSESWQYATAIAQIVSAFAVTIGVIVAICAITSNSKTARKSQTAIFLSESRSDFGFWDGHKVIRKIHESGRSFRSYVYDEALTEEDTEDRRQIHYFLNFFERVSVNVKNNIYDECMLKEVLYSTAVKNFEIVEPFIKALREKFNSQTYYQEYEWLAKRWQTDPLKINKK
ncbi:DUF4760 domain-containing protein [Photorhabdus tasmaniensis]